MRELIRLLCYGTLAVGTVFAMALSVKGVKEIFEQESLTAMLGLLFLLLLIIVCVIFIGLMVTMMIEMLLGKPDSKIKEKVEEILRS